MTVTSSDDLNNRFLRLDANELERDHSKLRVKCSLCLRRRKKDTVFLLNRRVEHFKTKYHEDFVKSDPDVLPVVPPAEPSMQPAMPASAGRLIHQLSPTSGSAGTFVSLISANTNPLPMDCSVTFDGISAPMLPPTNLALPFLTVQAPPLDWIHLNDKPVPVPVEVISGNQCISTTPLEFEYLPPVDALEVLHSLNEPSEPGVIPWNSLNFAVASGNVAKVRQLTEALRRVGVPQHKWLVRDKSGRHAADWAMERSMYFTDEAARNIFEMLGLLKPLRRSRSLLNDLYVRSESALTLTPLQAQHACRPAS